MIMRISCSMLFNFAFATILLVSPFVVGMTSSAWDSWLDTNDDGIIDITDIATIISNYGTMGDTTKSVNVTNWPITVTEETTVFYSNSSLPLTSANYSSSGFSYLHIFLFVLWPGPGSSCEFQVRGLFQDPDGFGSRWAKAYLTTMTETPRYDFLSLTIPVPSETFSFYVRLLSGGATIFLSFYLTYG